MRKPCVRYIISVLAVFLLAGCGEKLTEEQLATKAREAASNADYRQAKKYYEKLIKDFPQNNEVETARQMVALIGNAESLPEDQLQAEIQKHETHEQFNEALVLYNASLSRFPNAANRDETLQKVGLIYLNNQEQYQRAIDSYRRLLQEYPDSKHAAQAQFMVGYIYANHLKDFDQARTAYTTFKQKYPQHELMPSVDWELEHLGKDLGDLDFIANAKNEASGGGQPEPADKKPLAAPISKPQKR